MQYRMKHPKVGLVGAGYIASWHCDALKSLGINVVGVADPSVKARDQLADDYSIPFRSDSLDGLLNETELDAVHVLVPPTLHAPIAKDAIGRGLDVFLEKPMATNYEDCEELRELASSANLRLGINHNFLFFNKYLKFKEDLDRGLFGTVDQITLTWNKPLGQLQSGPWNSWLLTDPLNVVLEIFPHSIATIMDLGFSPGNLSVRLGDPVTLPNGSPFYRRWRLVFEQGRTEVELVFSFRAGFPEHQLRVRGSHGSAIVDFEDNLYTTNRSTEFMMLDVDRFVRLRRQARDAKRQATRQLASYGISKISRSVAGNAYGESIRNSIAKFYAQGEVDRGISPEFGSEVIMHCEQVRCSARESIESKQLVATESMATPDVVTAVPNREDKSSPSVLVLGGTGFIGRELVNKLVEHGQQVRLFARQKTIHPSLRRDGIEVFHGDLSDGASVREALDGVKCVYHLARSHGDTWQSYFDFDVSLTRDIAIASQDAGVEKFVYAGTIDSYFAGKAGRVITEDTGLDRRIRSRNLYALAKASAEAELLALRRDRGLPLVIARPGIVIGTGGNPFHWGVGFWNQSTVRYWGSGKNSLPFVLVEDVAEGMARIAEAEGAIGKSFNFVGDYDFSARNYVAELQKASGVHISQYATPIWRHYINDLFKWSVKVATRHPQVRFPSYRDWLSRTQLSQFDCSRAKEILDWQPHQELSLLIDRGIRLPAVEFVQSA